MPAFDIDARKVGRPLEEAIFAVPNNTKVFQPDLPRGGVVVQMGEVLDGVAPHMANYPPHQRFLEVCDEAGLFDEYQKQNPDVTILVKDDRGTAEGAREAANAALGEGAELIIAVGTHFNLIEFLERNRSGMSST